MNSPDQRPSIIEHLRDIIILPFTVTAIIPYIIYNKNQELLPDNFFLKTTGIIIFTSGLFLLLYTIYLFKSYGKGTLAPWTPTQKLVIRGPYGYCRNPMISGVLFMLTGETLFLHSTNILLWGCLFFLINTTYFILKEEPDLHKRFGEEYKSYKDNVPRWIPNIKSYKPN